MSNATVWELRWSHGGDPAASCQIVATDEEMQALVEEMKAKNPDITSVEFDVGAEAMSLDTFRTEYEFLFDKD